MSYFLFLDDKREVFDIYKNTPYEWMTAKCYSSFKDVIESFGPPIFVSFDHDLHDEHYIGYKKDLEGNDYIDYSKFKHKTGVDCAKWLVEYCEKNNRDLPSYEIHSFNPVGVENIKKVLNAT